MFLWAYVDAVRLLTGVRWCARKREMTIKRRNMAQMNKNLLILGAGQYGQVAEEIAEQSEMFETVALLDDLSDARRK